MSQAPLDERIHARAQLQHVATGLYADPTAALRAMRHEAHTQGAEAVRRKIEHDFTQYGAANPRMVAGARLRAQLVLRERVGADVERWLALDHQPPQQWMGGDNAIERGMRGPDAPSSGDVSATRRASPRTTPDPTAGLAPDERLAYERLEAFAEARERAELRQAAESELHALHDRRANLAAAEQNLPGALAAVRKEVEGTFRNEDKAMERIQAAIAQEGPTETARKVRTGALLGSEQVPIPAATRRFGILPGRDRRAEADARERVATRIEAYGHYEGAVKEWSTYTPPDGATVRGPQITRAALDREEARIRATHGIHSSEGPRARTGPPPHPSREARRLGEEAQEQLARLSPEGRERVVRAVQRSGSDRMGAALGHLQTLQMAARTIREGIEGPGG